jgi:DNA-binding phage protein
MTNIKILRQIIRENERLNCRICRATGLNRINLNRKLYNTKKFSIGEIIAIKSVLGLTMDETINIFAPFVAKYNEE